MYGRKHIRGENIQMKAESDQRRKMKVNLVCSQSGKYTDICAPKGADAYLRLVSYL